MRLPICLLFLSFAFLGSVKAAPVRPAPDFSWIDASGKLQNLKSFKGKPVVILIAPDSRNGHLKNQVKWIQQYYERLASMGTIFVVAFTQTPGRVASNVPFVIANDGPQVAYLYQVTKGSAIAIVGKDANLDYVTSKVVPGQRILDIIDNSYVNQEALRRE